MTRWTVKASHNKEAINSLSETLGVDTVIASLLLQREITNYEEAKKFFQSFTRSFFDEGYGKSGI